MLSKSVTLQKIRQLENQAKLLGLEERNLVENASSNLFSIIHHLNLGSKVVIIAGRGNNGADVLSCARKMLNKKYRVKVVLIHNKKANKECSFQLQLLKKLKIPFYYIRKINDITVLSRLFRNTDFILEGILGIGIKGEISDFLGKVIKKVIIIWQK